MGGQYLFRRFVQAFLTIVAIVVLNFFLFRMMPGSPERILLRNPHLTEETVRAARERWGLDQPLPVQLGKYLVATAQGDLGYSFQYRGQPVAEVIGNRFWPTIILIGLAEAIAIVVGLALGAYAGWKRGGKVDRVGQRREPDPVFDAVLRHRHAPDHHLRCGTGLVPDVGHARSGRDVRLADRPAHGLPEPPRRCPSPRSRSG